MMLLEVTIGMTKLAFSFKSVASIFPQWESPQSPKSFLQIGAGG